MSAQDIADCVQILYEDESAVMLQAAGLLVSILRGTISSYHLDKIALFSAQAASASVDGKARGLHVVNAARNHHTLNAAMRVSLTRLTEGTRDINAGTADVVLGVGVAYTVVRAVISTSSIVSGLSGRIKIFSDLVPGLAWVAERTLPPMDAARREDLSRHITAMYDA